ncbi:MAG: MCP four helix bundle domain-containing protein [Ignavibacteria bacterium]|nr:MCP four helix bundle domain-containing protein [Ignavibacteria bacterium]
MKIGTKLTISYATLGLFLLVMIILGIYVSNQLNLKIQALTYEHFRKTTWSNEVIDNLKSAAIYLRNAIITKNLDLRKLELEKLKGTRATVSSRLDSLTLYVTDSKGKSLLNDLVAIRKKYSDGRNQILKYLEENNLEPIENVLFGDFGYNTNLYIEKISEIIRYETEEFNKTAKQSEELYEAQLRTMIILGVLAILVTIFISIYLTKSITTPIRKAVDAANKIANGFMDVDLEVKTKDETSDLLNSMKIMRNNIKSLVEEIHKIEIAAINGHLDSRGREDEYNGEYKNIIKGLNETLDAIIKPLNVTAEYIDRISKGDIPPKIVEEYRGDFNEIKNNINQCIDAINLLIRDTYELVDNTSEGKITYRANGTRHLGDFRRLIEGINTSLDRLVGLIDNMPLPVQIVDRNNNVLYKNQIELD